MNKLVIMVGAPASGKSTYVKNNLKDYKVLSSDEIRKELFGDESCQSNNTLVFNTLYERARKYLLSGYNIVIDATCINIKERKRTLENFKDLNIERVAICINTPIEICYKQDQKRQRKVGKEVIDYFYSNFKVPTKEEGFDEVIIVDYKKNQPI